MNSNSGFGQLSLNELGDFFAGIVGPVALLWLVKGYVQQNAAISLQSGELKAAVEQHRAQVQATNAIAEHEFRHARIEYYRLVSEGAALIVNCQLLIVGDAETEARVAASKQPTLSPANALQLSIRQHEIGLQKAMKELQENLQWFGMERPAKPRDSIDILRIDVEKLTVNQNKIEAGLQTTIGASSETLETQFREIVLHIGNARKLLLRARLYAQLQELERISADVGRTE